MLPCITEWLLKCRAEAALGYSPKSRCVFVPALTFNPPAVPAPLSWVPWLVPGRYPAIRGVVMTGCRLLRGALAAPSVGSPVGRGGLCLGFLVAGRYRISHRVNFVNTLLDFK